MSQKKTASPGSVSHGTLRNEDLFQAFLSLLFSLDPDGCREFKKDHPSLLRALCDKECSIDNDYWETSEAAFDLEELFGVMETYAPKGHTFSSHPGDGSDFGYWPIDNL